MRLDEYVEGGAKGACVIGFLSHEGDKWSVKLDVRDLGGHLDWLFRGMCLLLFFPVDFSW